MFLKLRDEMKIKQLFLKIPVFAFCFIMILFYYNGLLYPQETNYWIAQFGLPILFLELLSLFVFISLSIFDYNSYMGGILLIVIVLIALFFTFFFNILIFLYFLLSIFIKFIAFKKERNIEETDEDMGGLGVTTLSWLIAIFIGIVFSSILNNFFPTQIEIIKKFILEQLPTGVHIVGNIGGMIPLWGISYFTCSIIFNIVVIIYNFRKNKDK